MGKKQYTHIFFDLDRTLWDFIRNSADVLKDIIDEFSLGSYVNDLDEFITKYNDYNDRLWDKYREGRIRKPILRQERFRMLLKDYGINDMEMVEKISHYYLNTCPAKPLLIKNSLEILEYLYDKYKLYIISNGFYDVQMAKMKNSGISRYFQKLFTSDRVGYAKPDSRFFDHAVKSVNAKKAESLVVGDDAVKDIEGARNARIDQVFFNPEGNISSVEATYEIRDLIELKSLL